jgi:hypothetical protein
LRDVTMDSWVEMVFLAACCACNKLEFHH